MDVTAFQHEITLLSSRLNYLKDVVQQHHVDQTAGTSSSSFPSPPDSPPQHVRPYSPHDFRLYNSRNAAPVYHGIAYPSSTQRAQAVYASGHQPIDYGAQHVNAHDSQHAAARLGHQPHTTAGNLTTRSQHALVRVPESTVSICRSDYARAVQPYHRPTRKFLRIAPAPPKSQSPPAHPFVAQLARSPHIGHTKVLYTHTQRCTSSPKPSKRGREEASARHLDSRPRKLSLSQPHSIDQLNEVEDITSDDSPDEDADEDLQALAPNGQAAASRPTPEEDGSISQASHIQTVDLTDTPDIIDLTATSNFVLVRPQSPQRSPVKAPKRIPLRWREGVQELLTAIPGPTMWKRRLEHSGLTDILHGERFARFFLENTLGVNRDLRFPSAADLDLTCAHAGYAQYDPCVKRIMCGVYTYSFMTGRERASAKAGTIERTLVEFRTMLLLASCAVLKAHGIPEELLFAMLQPAYGKAKPDHYRRMMRVAVWLTRLVDMLELLEVEELATELILLWDNALGYYRQFTAAEDESLWAIQHHLRRRSRVQELHQAREGRKSYIRLPILLGVRAVLGNSISVVNIARSLHIKFAEVYGVQYFASGWEE